MAHTDRSLYKPQNHLKKLKDVEKSFVESAQFWPSPGYHVRDLPLRLPGSDQSHPKCERLCRSSHPIMCGANSTTHKAISFEIRSISEKFLVTPFLLVSGNDTYLSTSIISYRLRMSCTETETETETETLVTLHDAKEIENNSQMRKTARIDEPLKASSKNELRPRRVCRRHSYAFRCAEDDIDENGDEGKHYESVLLVRVLSSGFRRNC